MERRSLPVLSPAGPADGATARAVGGAVRDLAASAPAGLRVAMITLGCDKNTVDSQRILGDLAGAGVALVDSPDQADVVLVNTCGFIEMAKQESIDTLLEATRLKEEGRVRAVIGMGCLVQRHKSELETEMPEVDLFLGLTQADRLVPALVERGFISDDVPLMERPLRMLTTEATHTSHLKISEGCDHTCAFCAIPLMRGKFRSTPIDLLVREARELEAAGVVELNIVSQDTTWYGRDWARALARGEDAPVWGAEGESYYLGRRFDRMPNLTADPGTGAGTGAESGEAERRRRLASLGGGSPEAPVRSGPFDLSGVTRTGALPLLLRTLIAETTVPWLRLFYMYPSGITRELVELMASEPRILPYLDMPLQHGSDRILERMRRPERRATILERVAWLREAIPDLALRTTVIVGFPGETEDDFDELVELLEEIRFDHVGAFSYSEEEDTLAATMEDQVPEAVRRERLERLMDVQRAIALQRNEERVGLTTTVLIEDEAEDGLVGRAPWQGPEVDGTVFVEGARGIAPGTFVRARITTAEEHDLDAVLVDA